MTTREASVGSAPEAALPPPPGPPWHAQPALLRRLFRDPVPVLDHVRAEYGGVCMFGAGPVRMAVVGDPAALRELFAMPTDRFRWGHRFNVLGFVVGDESMIVSDGDDYRRRRSSVQAAFAKRRLNRWIPMIIERTDAAIDALADELGDRTGSPVDLFPVGRRLVLDVVVRAFFGERFVDRVDEIGELFEASAAYLESPAIRQLPHPFPYTRRAKVRADRRALDELIDAEIAQRRASTDDDPFDVLSALVRDGQLSDAEIRDQVVTLIGAGHDTTAASLAWMIWCCAVTPGVWDRLRAEADEVLGATSGNSDAPFDESTLARLVFADHVMRETLRLHPAGVLAPREAAVDIALGGYRIPARTMVLWSAHLAGRDPSVWTDPLAFDPDRFDRLEGEQRRVADLAWVPFGHGRRNCIGFVLAQMELTLMIARLAQRLPVWTTATSVPRPVGMVVNRPEGGVPMQVSVRRGD